MYQVLARKWRPQNFGELVGQPHVARTLTNAIQSDRLAHAYIFAGLRGTGKTTVARILAKCLNCEQGPTETPCGECASCLEVAESRSIDVLELDAASRRGINDVRELQQVVNYAPSRDRYKVLILDEFHMLTKEAFNALLKTLEEPPPNILFVLATTEIQKVLPTILSRCQVFEFRRVGPAEVARHLKKICDAEGIEISDASLDRLARYGEGSVRDSISVLERIFAFCGEKVDDDDVLRALGAVRGRVLVDIVAALARRDAGGMLGVLDGLIDEGHDLLHFWKEWITAVRDLLLLDTLPDRQELLSRSPEDSKALADAAEGLSREDLTRTFQLLADLEPALKSSSQPRFLFEITLLRLASLGAVKPIEEVLQSLGEPPRQPTAPRTPAPRQQKKKLREPPPEPPIAPTAESSDFHGRLVAEVREARPMLGAMLEQASAIEVGDAGLTIRFKKKMEAVRRQLEQKESLDLLRQAASRIAGRELRVALDSGGGAGEGPAAAPAASRTAGPPPRQPPPVSPPATETGPAEARGLLEDARREPGVRMLLDAFGAHVVDIRKPGRPRQKPAGRGKAAQPSKESP